MVIIVMLPASWFSPVLPLTRAAKLDEWLRAWTQNAIAAHMTDPQVDQRERAPAT
ncbi:MAG: hypothetical protein AB7S36_20565 [Planctomycetota bacterium]